jgi:hypothetical protein
MSDKWKINVRLVEDNFYLPVIFHLSYRKVVDACKAYHEQVFFHVGFQKCLFFWRNERCVEKEFI